MTTAISSTSVGVWTGFDTSWGTIDNCSNWEAPLNNGNGGYGWANQTAIDSGYSGSGPSSGYLTTQGMMPGMAGSQSCYGGSNQSSLYCVQQ